MDSVIVTNYLTITNMVTMYSPEVAGQVAEKSINGFVTFSAWLIGLVGLLLVIMAVRYAIDKGKLDAVASEIKDQRRDLDDIIEANKKTSGQNEKISANLVLNEEITINHFATLWASLGMEYQSKDNHSQAIILYLNELEILSSSAAKHVPECIDCLLRLIGSFKLIKESQPEGVGQLVSFITRPDKQVDLNSIVSNINETKDSKAIELMAQVMDFFSNPPTEPSPQAPSPESHPEAPE
ncbi:hypothetical protein PDESU_04739 [Pontiella desulfatans]|uniref:Uncharacterized protein n=1 Tax=Pontiella desulfatans TaxID=2750659 RepID=A0A6C2U8E6_PONDE|nr:hypothetical protein [Pontiella desulfatans]VGO16149.1 hypothetical protein PDESU_04739 [Pontiella desulfatans]